MFLQLGSPAERGDFSREEKTQKKDLCSGGKTLCAGEVSRVSSRAGRKADTRKRGGTTIKRGGKVPCSREGT